jgi:hypothetical protein
MKKGSILLVLCFIITCIPFAQNAQFNISQYQEGSRAGFKWKFEDNLLRSSYPFPAITILGKDGGPAFYRGLDNKGIYVTFNGDNLLLTDKRDNPVIRIAQLPDKLELVKTPEVAVQRNLSGGGPTRPGYPLLKFPCGRNGKVSWAYPTGGWGPSVWIEGEGKVVYLGQGNNGLTSTEASYFYSKKTGKKYRWDGALTEIDSVPDLYYSRASYIKYADPSAKDPLSNSSRHHIDHSRRNAPYSVDPFFGMRPFDQKLAFGCKLGWYYPSNKPGNFPSVTIYGKNGGSSVYLGFDENGSYLLLNGQYFVWDADQLKPIDKVPNNLYNNGVANEVANKANISISTIFKKLDKGDPFFPISQNGNNGVFSWEYGSDFMPYLRGVGRYTSSFNNIRYHGYNEHGAYLTLVGGEGDIDVMWDGSNVIPVENIPDNLYNKPSK